MSFNSIIYFSFIFSLLLVLLLVLLYCQLGSCIIVPKSTIGSNSSFYIPIYQDLLLILTSFFFTVNINLIEVLLGFNDILSVYHIHFFSSIWFSGYPILSLFIIK
jgi:hypothetical protein